MITVFTPAYNRSKELNRVYKSLLNQDYNDFEWLIVDDGSTDNTNEVVNKLIKEKKLNIRYINKKNGGKPSAYNIGLKNAKGDIFMCLDSDDMLESNVLKMIYEDFKLLDNNKVGYIYLCGDINSNCVIGTKLPDISEAKYYDVYFKYKVTGDKFMVFKTDIAKKYSFPIINKEKFVPEALIFNRISDEYTFALKNVIVCKKEYLTGGYTNNYFNLVKRNPNSNRLYYLEDYKYHKTLKNIYGYILFSLYSKISFSKILEENPSKLKTVLMFLPTWIVYKVRK